MADSTEAAPEQSHGSGNVVIAVDPDQQEHHKDATKKRENYLSWEGKSVCVRHKVR